MKVSLLKTISSASLVLLSAALFAETSDRIEKLEEEMAQIGTCTAIGSYGAKFAPASAHGNNRLYLTVEGLYWHAKAGGTDYAFTVETAGTNTSAQTVGLPPVVGSVKDNSFSWDWGIRGTLGYEFAHDQWDINANYTAYESSQSSGTSKNMPAYILSTRINEKIRLSEAKSMVKLGYNNVNLELGRHYFVSHRLSFMPHFGVKSSWIDLKQNVSCTINTLFDQGDPSLNGKVLKTDSKSNLWAIGPRAGIKSEIYLGDGFSIEAGASTGLLYGYYRSLVHYKPGDAIPNVDAQRDIKSKTHRFTPSMQLFLGLIWERYVLNNEKHITLGAGYEVEYFWRANQMLYLADIENPNSNRVGRNQVDFFSEDIMFYGLTFKVRLGF